MSVRMQGLGAALALVVMLALLVAPSAAQVDCGPIVATGEVEVGMVGEGVSVAEGTEPFTFVVEVLGVLENGNGPGRDVIVVEVDSPEIREAGGIWFGMSGSPVYVDGELLGAVALGFSFGPSRIGGLTAAEDLVEIASLPSGEPRSADHSGEVRLRGDLAQRVVQREPRARQAGLTLAPLPVPYAISGLAPQRMDDVGRWVDAQGMNLRPYAAGSAAFDGLGETTRIPEPGDNVAVGAAYGDVTAAAVGTTALVCDDTVVAFAHGFNATGTTTLGIGEAEAIAVIPDANGGPFKLANIGALYGTADQDRFTGVRGLLGGIPEAVPVRSTVTDTDLDTSRQGATDVVDTDQLSFSTFLHLLSNLDAVSGRIGEGTAELSFTIQGTGSETGPFTLQRDDVWASPFDISSTVAGDIATHVDLLDFFGREDVAITSVESDVRVRELDQRLLITEVLVGVDGAPPVPVDPAFGVVAPAGSQLDIVATLDGVDGELPDREVEVTVPVPDVAGGVGSLTVSGGHAFGGLFPVLPEECLLFPEACPGVEAETLPELVERLQTAPRGDDLVAELALFDVGGPGQPQPAPVPAVTEEPVQPVGAEETSRRQEPRQGPTPQPTPGPTPPPPSPTPPPGSPGGSITERVIVSAGDVVDGFRSIPLQVVGEQAGGATLIERVAGSNRFATAGHLAQAALPGGADTVVLAPGGQYAPALVAAPLALSEAAPVLLTDGGTIPPATAEAITGTGATSAILVAPDGVYDEATQTALADLGVTDVRTVGGPDVFAVAAAVAEEFEGSRAFVVEGADPDPSRGWPDALAVSSLAAQTGTPILLTDTDQLPQATADAVSALGPTATLTVVGGTGAVSEAVEAQLVDLGVAEIGRVAGSTRYETALELALRAVQAGADPRRTWTVTGDGFADALGAGPAAAATGGVLMLVDGDDLEQSPPAGAWFGMLARSGAHIRLVGGPSVISDQVAGQINALVNPRPANDDFADAEVVEGNAGQVSGSTVGATRQPGEPAPFGEQSGSIWYRWTPQTDGTATWLTAGSGFDTVLAVYTGDTVDALTEIASNDDVGPTLSSQLEFPAASGQTYHVYVAGFATAQGSVELSWQHG